MATYSWNQASGAGQWSTAADWTNLATGLTGTIPGATDTALITQAGTYSITWTGKGAAATVQAGNVQIDATGATVTIQSGRTLAVSNSVTLDSGTLTEAGRLTLGAGFLQDGGVFNASGTIIASGPIALTGGSAAIAAGVLTLSAGGLTIGANGTQSAGALTLTGGTASITGGTTLQAGALTVTNTGTASAGYLTTDTLTVTGGQLSQSGSASEIVVNGAASLTGGSATITAGTFYDTAAGLSLGGGASFTQAGGYVALSGQTTVDASTAALNGGTFYVIAGGLSVANGGSVIVNGASATVNGASTIAGGGEVLADGTFYVASGGLTVINNGSVSVAAGLESIAGGLALTGGNATVTGGTLYASSGGMAIGDASGLTVSGGLAQFAGGLSLTAGGGIGISAGALVGDSMAVSGGSLTMTGGALTLTGAASVTGGSVAITGGTVSLGQLILETGLSLSGASTVLSTNTNGTTLGATGALTGQGTVNGAIAGSGTIVAEGGVLDLTGSVMSSQVSLDVDGSTASTLELDGTVAPGTTVTFLNNGTIPAGTLFLGNATAVASFATTGTIVGMSVGLAGRPYDAVDLGGIATSGIASATITNHGTTVELLDATAGVVASFTLGGTVQAGTTVGWTPDGSGGTDVFLLGGQSGEDGPCFASGTRIRTPRGDVAVEQLTEGEAVVVVTPDGQVARPVRWIGHRRVNLRAHRRPVLAAPVHVRRGAIAPGLPCRDLVLSPDHCLYLQGRLVPVKLLINDGTIWQDRDAACVTYYHIELDRHGILLAEGLPVESYLDTGNRAQFENAGVALVLHPEFEINAALRCWETDACAPLASDAATVRPIWERLARRADRLACQPPAHATTDDPALHLMVDGQVVRPTAVHGMCHSFLLPAGARRVRLASRASMPSETAAYLDDWRNLGVAVSRIVVRGTTWDRVIPADHPALRRGWYQVERCAHAVWRWTDGDAELPIGPAAGPVTIDVHVQITRSYRLAA